MKLWSKGFEPDQLIERFTVGADRELDLRLARYDVQGSMAHIRMLESIGLLSKYELDQLLAGLQEIAAIIEEGNFRIDDGVEDVHSQVEFMLTAKLGDIGKKIHSGRSRNDQVLVDLKLFMRDELRRIASETERLFHKLLELSENHKDVLMPGYTHLQVAMPSSFGSWFGAYAESLADDMQLLVAIAAIASTLGHLAMDVCMWMCQNFGFVSFPDELTTGSSIMPHKKNPDVFEIMRGKCNRLTAVPNEIALLTANLPLGYNRDLQLLKDIIFPATTELAECLDIATFMLGHMQVRRDIVSDPRYDYLFTVEEVNRLVLGGMPFREAYRKVGLEVQDGTYRPVREVHHTHAGSISNLCSDRIAAKFDALAQKLK